MENADKNIEDIIYLIQKSPLDELVKEILIRDLRAEGLTDFLKEQILAYCNEGINKADEQIARAQNSLS